MFKIFSRRNKNAQIYKYKLNLKRDAPDSRDHLLKYSLTPTLNSIKKEVDLRSKFPSVFSQNDQGSCTANAGVAVLEYLFKEFCQLETTLSRQYLYNKERMNDGTSLNEDSGSSIRQICKTLKKNGCCRELNFEYGWDNFYKEPSTAANEDAALHRIFSYERCENLYDIKFALSQNLPVLAGIEIYEEFYKATKSGFIPKADKEKSSLGGHAVVIVGYRPKKFSKKNQYLIRNSWGESIEKLDSWGYAFNNPSDSGWGQDGYAWIDEDELASILMDAWVITGV